FCGEEAYVTGAQVSRRALGNAVEEYASVLLRSQSGVLGTIEVGNIFPTPRDETIGAKEGKVLDEIGWLRADGEFKIAGRDLHRRARGGVLGVAAREGDRESPTAPQGAPAREALRAAFGCWRRGRPAPATARDCYRAIALVDQAYAYAAK